MQQSQIPNCNSAAENSVWVFIMPEMYNVVWEMRSGLQTSVVDYNSSLQNQPTDWWYLFKLSQACDHLKIAPNPGPA